MDEKEIPLHKSRIEQSGVAKEQEDKRRRQRKMLDLACAEVFASPSGQRVLKLISEICGHGVSKVGGNPQLGMDVLQGTLYNAARENVYLELRKFIPTRILREVDGKSLADDDEFLL